MKTYLLGIIDTLSTGDTDRVVLRLNIEILLVHPRQFNDGNQIITLLENIDRRIGTRAGGGVCKPVTRKTIFKGSLKGKKCFEGIGLAHDQYEASWM